MNVDILTSYHSGRNFLLIAKTANSEVIIKQFSQKNLCILYTFSYLFSLQCCCLHLVGMVIHGFRSCTDVFSKDLYIVKCINVWDNTCTYVKILSIMQQDEIKKIR